MYDRTTFLAEKIHRLKDYIVNIFSKFINFRALILCYIINVIIIVVNNDNERNRYLRNSTIIIITNTYPII